MPEPKAHDVNLSPAIDNSNDAEGLTLNEDVNQESGEVTVDLAEVERLAGVKPSKEAPPDDRVDDATAGQADGDEADDDEDDDRRAKSGGDDTEEKRARRRQERAAKRDRIAAERAELEELRARVASVEAGSVQLTRTKMVDDFHAIEAGMAECGRAYQDAMARHADAVSKADGAAAAKALQDIDAARSRFGELQGQQEQIRAAYTQTQRSDQQQQTQKPPLHPILKEEAAKFTEDFKWYKTDGSDRDSAHVLKIDAQMAAEGWLPTTRGYWVELRSRVQEELPHKFGKRPSEGSDSPRGPRTGGSGREGGAPGSSGRAFTLSRARVEALKEAGMWDDPKQRAKMILKYQQDDAARQRRGDR